MKTETDFTFTVTDSRVWTKPEPGETIREELCRASWWERKCKEWYDDGLIRVDEVNASIKRRRRAVDAYIEAFVETEEIK